MAVIEFLNTETETALAPFSPFYKNPEVIKAETRNKKLPALAPKVAYQKWKNGHPVFTLITRE